MPVVAERFVSLTEASPRTFSNTSLSIPEQCPSGACGRPAESEDSELSVCPRAYLRNYMLDLHLIFCMLPMSVVRSSFGGVAIHYVLPVLWMTLCLHRMARNKRHKSDLIRSIDA